MVEGAQQMLFEVASFWYDQTANPRCKVLGGW
jgi:hypothetical protein